MSRNPSVCDKLKTVLLNRKNDENTNTEVKVEVLGKIAIALACLNFIPLSNAATVTIDTSRTYQIMEGFGSSQRLFKDPHIIGGADSDQDSANGLDITPAATDTILKKLYSELGLTRMRVGLYPARIEPVNDNADPNVTDLSKFNFAWKMNDGFFEYVNRARPFGLKTWWHSPGNLESWMSESNPEEYVEWAMAIIRRWRANGLEFPYWSIINEPSYPRSGLWSGAYLRNTVKLLGAKLKAEGFKTKIVIPDDVRSSDAEAKAKIILADSVARQYVGALAFHLYDEPVSNVSKMKALGEQYGLPLWMSEYSVSGDFAWLTLMHDLIANYNVSAVDHMGGFGQGDGGYVNFNFSGTQYLGYILPKKYYYVGHFSKFVRPGYRRIEAAASDHNIKVAAFKSDTAIVLVVINTTKNLVQADVSFLQTLSSKGFAPVRTDGSANWQALPEIPVSGGGKTFGSALSPLSVTTFVSTYSPSPSVSPTGGPVNPPSLLITPNPCRVGGTVNFSGGAFDQLTIHDMSGRMVQRLPVGGGDWNTIGFEAGFFIVRIQKDSRVFAQIIHLEN